MISREYFAHGLVRPPLFGFVPPENLPRRELVSLPQTAYQLLSLSW